MTKGGFPYDGDDELYSALGKLTISWAYAEFGLDWLIREIHEPLRAGAKVPIALNRKLEYLRKAFGTVDRLATFRERFEKIADQIHDAAEERHDLIHGLIVSQASDRAVMVRLVPGIKQPKIFPVDSISILKAAVRADGIQAMSFAAEISKFLATHKGSARPDLGDVRDRQAIAQKAKKTPPRRTAF